jgi:hypothetical protein
MPAHPLHGTKVTTLIESRRVVSEDAAELPLRDLRRANPEGTSQCDRDLSLIVKAMIFGLRGSHEKAPRSDLHPKWSITRLAVISIDEKTFRAHWGALATPDAVVPALLGPAAVALCRRRPNSMLGT